MQIKIEKMKTEPLGKWTKIFILSGGKTYNCLKGKWNSEWKVGDIIEAEVEVVKGKRGPENRIKAPQFNDFSKSSNESWSSNSNPKIDEILDLCKKILAAVSSTVSSNVNVEAGTKVSTDFEEEVPASEGNPVFDEEIPF